MSTFYNGREFERCYDNVCVSPAESYEQNGDGFHARLVDATDDNKIVIDADVGVVNTLFLRGGTAQQYNNSLPDYYFEKIFKSQYPDATKEDMEFVFCEYTQMPARFVKYVKDIVKDEMETRMIQRESIDRFQPGFCCRRIGDYMALREKKRFSKKYTLKIGSLGLRKKGEDMIIWLFGNGANIRAL